MSKEKSKVQKGIEFIFAHPGARSDALGKVMECEPKNVQAFMGPVLEAGLIVSCKVERPGQQTINEYKPSSAAPDKCPENWLDWKRANAPQPVKPLRFKATGPRDGLPKSGSARETQAVSGDVTTAAAAECSPSGKRHLPSSEAAIEVQAGSHGPEEVKASTSAPAASATAENKIERLSELDLFATLGLSGAMTIQFKGETMHLPVSAVRELGRFMIATESAWA